MAEILKIAQVRKHFKEKGCKLLEKEYVNSRTKMRYVCLCGNESSINWSNFKLGRRCGCGRKEIRTLHEDKIKKEVEARGCIFISNEYKSGRNTIRYICKCGSERKCKLNNFRLSERCRECFYKDLALDFEFVKNYFSENGCELLEKEYKNARKKLKYRCSCGKESEICFCSFKNGNRCRECGNKKVSEWLSKNWQKESHPRWIKDREAKRINDAFCDKCRFMVKRTLQLFEQAKTSRTEEILGYKFADLKSCIESHKNWNRVKNKDWHIDHIFPLKAFVDYGILDVRLANCLDNLQPMLGHDNISKSAKYDRSSFEDWLRSKGVNLGRRKAHREIKNCGI